MQAKSLEKNRLAKNKARLLLIEKTKQADVIGEKLDAAWSAYESADYAEAKQLYQEVVLVEEDNRDALLGLGAIAVIEKDTITAKKRYRSLLELNPNDPLAIAALTNLRSDDSSPKRSEKYLVSMLEKTPDVAQLNFELGNVYAQQNKWSAAQQSYFKAWQQESENADYIFNLAVSLDQLSQQQQAINFYKDSLLKAKNKQVNFSRETVEKRVNELSGL
jgi:Flp pilus assembly protein TadD